MHVSVNTIFSGYGRIIMYLVKLGDLAHVWWYVYGMCMYHVRNLLAGEGVKAKYVRGGEGGGGEVTPAF